jgi:biuret amidohydrolase
MGFPVVPEKMALVNVDMQNCFVENSPIAAPDGLTVLERINRLATVCRQHGICVIHTSHVLRPDGSNLGVMAKIGPPITEGILNKGAASSELHPGVQVRDTDILLDKPRFGALYGTDLELILRGRGIDTIIVTGIATNICCETTAREANARDFRVFFLSDGTATFGIDDLSADDIQKATCTTLGRIFAEVLTVEEMINKIQQATG